MRPVEESSNRIPFIKVTILQIARQELPSRIVGIDRVEFLFLPRQVARQHRRVPSLPEMILPTILPIEVEMHKTPVGRDLPHIQHRVIRETIRQITTARDHVVISRP